MAIEPSWRMTPGKPLGEEFARLACDEIRSVKALLTSADTPRDEAIHKARRSFKKLRALVRLARPSLGSSFQRENHRWRDLGRLLAASRDAAVLLGSFEKMADAAGIPARHRTALRARLARRKSSPDGAQPPEIGIERAAAELESALREVSALSWPERIRDLQRGLRASQARLKQRFKAALRETGSDGHSEALHDWRKAVKDLCSQLALFNAVLPAGLKKSRKAANALGELLGEEHDLCLLRARLAEEDLPAGLGESAARVAEAADARRAVLRESALRLGEPLSRHAAGELARTIAERWRAARATPAKRSGRCADRPHM